MKQSLAARFLFRAVVLAFLVYAMLLTWWTPFTGDSFMHSVFGADHRLAFQPVLERCWWSYMHWNPRLGEFLAIFTATAGKWLFLALNPFVLLSLALMMFFLARGRRVNSGNWRDVLLFTVGALLLLTSSSRPGITMFWLSGGTNYAWSAAIWLGFLCLYRSLWAGTSRIRDTPFSWLWIGGMAFAAGMTNENQIPASLGMLFVYWFYARCRGMVLPCWFFIGWGFHALGGAFLLLAPGNAARLHSETAGGAAVLHSWGERFSAIPELVNAFYEFMPIPKILLAVAAAALILLTVEAGINVWRGKAGRRMCVSLLFILVAHAMAISFFVRVIPGMARHVFRYGIDDDGNSGIVRGMDGCRAKAVAPILRAAGGRLVRPCGYAPDIWMLFPVSTASARNGKCSSAMNWNKARKTLRFLLMISFLWPLMFPLCGA